MSNTVVVTWRGQTINTVGELTDALHGIVRRGNPSEAALFLERYREAAGKHAETNIGYCLGYLAKDNMVAGLRLFNLRHPFFGTADEAKKINPKQAFLLGQELAAASGLDGKVVPKEGPKRKASK